MSVTYDPSPASTATPPPERDARQPHRHHRWLTMPSGWLFPLCLFLPALPTCNGTMPLLLLPPTWPWAIGGLLIAATALARSRSDVEASGQIAMMLFRMTAISVTIACGFAIHDDGFNVTVLVIGALGTAIGIALPWRPRELAVVTGCATFSLIGAVILTIAALGPKSLYGLTVAATASWINAAGCIAWFAEARRRQLD